MLPCGDPESSSMLYSWAYISRENAISSFATQDKDLNTTSQFSLVSVSFMVDAVLC